MNTGYGSTNQDLTGALPAGLGDLGPAMGWLGLSSNAITSVPTELGALTGFAYLDLSSNQISELPTELGALTGLTYLVMTGNVLTAVPTEIAALTGLKFLSLDGNAVTSVPTEIGALTALTFLDFSNNDITSVPTELGALTSLTNLQVPGNALTSLPSEIVAAMTGLDRLELNNNQLTGVPAEFRTVDPSFGQGIAGVCYLSGNPGFSCANVGAGTSCCTADNCGDTSTCYGSPCAYTDTTCAAGSICPGGTLVSATCADRSGFDENPCACTALQELAALSAANLATVAPWNDLASASYCTLDGNYYDVSEPHWIAIPVSRGRVERLTDWRAGCSTTATMTIWISTSGARWSTE